LRFVNNDNGMVTSSIEAPLDAPRLRI
jgi:hypothetical protein